ncbi:glycosyltransferase family 39 protein [Patescibacteria group bacterium]|nr:glycosyltransferase family 39 protein [Patescibacteria group bacterium]
MKKILSLDVLVFLFLLLFLPLFFWNLGGFGLADFDEAWYAAIARNIIHSGNPYLLTFNSGAYLDHPYLGFFLMALSMKLFGITEFAARFPSAILGFLSVYFLYLLGKNLFSRLAGLASALVLLSSVWFIFRSRTGNLDAVFVFFLIISFYLATKVCHTQKSRWLILFGLSLGGALMVKSVIGVVALVPIILYFLLIGRRFKFQEILLIVLSCALVVMPWLVVNYFVYGLTFINNMIGIGTRSGSRMMPNFSDLGGSQTMNYLHWGIRKWYYPAVLSLFASIILVIREKRIVPVIATVLIFLLAFLTNRKTEIWHLIPLYPFLALLIGFTVWKFSLWLKIPGIILAGLFIGVAFWQIFQFRNEIKLTDSGLNSWSAVALAAKGRSEPLYLDGPDLWPTTVYYSQKRVNWVIAQTPPADSLMGMMASGQRPFLLITEQWRLDQDKINPAQYQLLAANDGKVLILAKSL